LANVVDGVLRSRQRQTDAAAVAAQKIGNLRQVRFGDQAPAAHKWAKVVAQIPSVEAGRNVYRSRADAASGLSNAHHARGSFIELRE
jgi:hypothetical protein